MRSLGNMTDTANEIRSEMAATRDRMADDINEIKAEAAERVHAAKERVNVMRMVREHPWPALGAAVALGAAIGGSGADMKAAAATVAGAKKAAQVSKEAATNTIAKLHSSDDESPAPVRESEVSRPRIGDKVSVMLGALVMRGLDRVLEEMRAAAHDWGTRMAGPSRSTTGRRPGARAATPVREAVVAVREEIATARGDAAAAQVPVPNEMLPTEIGLRADAVEALGGGTHEPPLEPGAGELGARWS
ncbi:MAG TPA: hypothetical protein VGJ18_15960 [Gemmatimonadaceae bacterium]|jgi:ElaB/YqjD/DUF883 family membrane-anchored ribosome-binding protein